MLGGEKSILKCFLQQKLIYFCFSLFSLNIRLTPEKTNDTKFSHCQESHVPLFAASCEVVLKNALWVLKTVAFGIFHCCPLTEGA